METIFAPLTFMLFAVSLIFFRLLVNPDHKFAVFLFVAIVIFITGASFQENFLLILISVAVIAISAIPEKTSFLWSSFSMLFIVSTAGYFSGLIGIHLILTMVIVVATAFVSIYYLEKPKELMKLT